MTVFTPEALAKMVASGNVRKVKLKDLAKTNCDEIFYYRFPSASVLNEMNGDGDFVTVHDYATDHSKIFLNCTEIQTSGETEVYVR